MAKYYVKPQEIWQEMKICKEKGRLTQSSLNMLTKIADGYANTMNYTYQQDREDCIAGAIHDCAKYWENFMPFNKKMIKDLIDMELWQFDEYEFCSKESKAKKSIAPERAKYKGEDGVIRWVKRKDINDEKKVVYLYHPKYDYIIEKKFGFQEVDYLIKAHEEADDVVYIDVESELTSTLGYQKKGYYKPSKKTKKVELSKVEYWLSETGEKFDDISDVIELSCSQVYENVVWSDVQKFVRSELYKKESLKKVKLEGKIDDELLDVFNQIKDLYATNFKSNAFAYFTQQVKNGLRKQWNEFYKKLPYSSKVSLNINDENNGLFTI